MTQFFARPLEGIEEAALGGWERHILPGFSSIPQTQRGASRKKNPHPLEFIRSIRVAKQVSSITRIKVRIYLLALLVGIFVALGVWWLNFSFGSDNAFSRVYLPCLVIVYLVAIYGLWQQDEKFIQRMEQLIYASSVAYILGLFTFKMMEGMRAGAASLDTFFLWMAMLYIAPFIMFNSKTALRLSLGTYGYILAVGMYFLVNTPGGPHKAENIHVIFQVLVSNLLYLIVLSVIVHLKDKVQEAETQSSLMSRLAHTDPLTGLSNRRRLTDMADALIQERIAFSIVLMDIDDFKKINDKHGHDAGDRVLQYFSSALEKLARKEDMAGRWGGDEFLILCPGLGHTGLASLLRRLETVGAHQDPQTAHPFRLSFGLATWQEADTIETLLKRADLDMYRNKNGKPE